MCTRRPARWMCSIEDDVKNQGSRRPADTGHAGYEATDFLDTMPLSRDEVDPPPIPVLREPVGRAIARQERAPVAPPAAIGADRERPPQRMPVAQPASPVPMRTQASASASRNADVGPRTGATPPPARAARAAPQVAAMPANAGDSSRLRESRAVDGRKAHVAAFAPSRHGTAQGSTYSEWASASRQSPFRAPVRHAGSRRASRAGWMSAAMLAAITFGVFMYGARKGAERPHPGASVAASLPHPAAAIALQEAQAVAAAPDAPPGAEAARSTANAPDATGPSRSRPFAASARKPETRGQVGTLPAAADPGPKSQPLPAAGGVAGSTAVAAAVEAAKAKADAFLRGNVQVAPEQEPAESSPRDSVAASDRP